MCQVVRQQIKESPQWKNKAVKANLGPWLQKQKEMHLKAVVLDLTEGGPS